MPVVAAKSSVQDGVRIGIGFIWVWIVLGLLVGLVAFCWNNPEVLLLLVVILFVAVAYFAAKGRKAMERDKRKAS